jgi:hypothetical protein
LANDVEEQSLRFIPQLISHVESTINSNEQQPTIPTDDNASLPTCTIAVAPTQPSTDLVLIRSDELNSLRCRLAAAEEEVRRLVASAAQPPLPLPQPSSSSPSPSLVGDSANDDLLPRALSFANGSPAPLPTASGPAILTAPSGWGPAARVPVAAKGRGTVVTTISAAMAVVAGCLGLRLLLSSQVAAAAATEQAAEIRTRMRDGLVWWAGIRMRALKYGGRGLCFDRIDTPQTADA